ncbi:MAG: hypothetical protein GKR98_11610 [Boseongicola sp.]|nr:MAG: hypothetical protein GKR98_11610 [Boseongicola sp.]
MGYDVHITRKSDWADEDGAIIARSEWMDYVTGDKSMRLDQEAVVENNIGEQFSIRDETLAVWTEWGERSESRNEAWMWHSAGNVVAKNPDKAILRKMFLIADALGAKLQGDKGEVYNSTGDLESYSRAAALWWKFW